MLAPTWLIECEIAPRFRRDRARLCDALARLAADTDEAMSGIGVPREEKQFSPHLTLARTREETSREKLNSLRRAAAGLESDGFGTFEAGAQYLYLSRGGKYTKLAQVEL